MHTSNQALAQFSKLFEAGITFPFKIGTKLARGFADLGFEEFYLLGNNQLVSIYTGQASELTNEHIRFFFVVPDFKLLYNKVVSMSGFVLNSLQFLPEAQKWQIRGLLKEQPFEAVDQDLLLLLAATLIAGTEE